MPEGYPCQKEKVCCFGCRDASTSRALWWTTARLSADAACLLPPRHAPPPRHAAAPSRHASTPSMTCLLFCLDNNCLLRKGGLPARNVTEALRISAVRAEVFLRQRPCICDCCLRDGSCGSVSKMEAYEGCKVTCPYDAMIEWHRTDSDCCKLISCVQLCSVRPKLLLL